MNMLSLIMFVGLSVFIFFLFFYILRLEKIIEQKFAAMELSLEELNKEMFLVKKELKEKELKSIEKLENIIDNLVDDIKFLEEKNKQFYKEVEEKIAMITMEYKKNSISNVSNLSKHEEGKIVSLYKSGYSIEEISKHLRIPTGEVELILKFSDL